MPDSWETAHGLDPNNAKDGAIVSLSADDYTNLELYLNELAGDPVEYNGNISYDPISGNLVSVEVLDTAYYNSWTIDSSLEIGDAVFGDRSAERCAVSQIPDSIQDAEIILTPCDAKASGSAQADLTAVKDITLFVGVDSRVTSAPSWLNNWTKSGISLSTSNDVIFELYALELKAGEIVTLGANGQATGCMNYIILASDNVTSEVRVDLNMDGKLDVADVALLQKWLLAVPDTELANWKAGDLCEDGLLNAYDLCMMKRKLLNKAL